MRVTRNSFYSLTSGRLAKLSTRLRDVQERAVSGLSYERPSDAPGKVREIHELRAAAGDQEQWASNAGDASGCLDAMDGALADATNVIVRAREIAVGMASETADSDSRTTAATEVAGLKTQMLQAANTNFGGRYLFAGTAYDTPPYDDTGAWQGSTDEPEAQVGQSSWVRTGLVGQDVFQGSVDILATLQALQDALTANDPAAVQDTLTNLDAATNALSLSRGDIANDSNLAQDAVNVSESLGAILNSRLVSLVSAEPTTTYLDLSDIQGTYEAALQVAGSAMPKSLFDYLR